MAIPGVVSYPTAIDDAVSLFGTGNRLSITLNGGISFGFISIVLTNASGWPNSGIISFNDTFEIAYYTFKSSNTLNGVIRGQDGTSAAAHLTGVIVQLNDTSR